MDRTTVMLQLVASLALGVALVALGTSLATLAIIDDVNDRLTAVPACTDAIADAGGICIGEPR